MLPVFPNVKTEIRFTSLYTLIESIIAALKKGNNKIYRVGDKEKVKLIEFVEACRSPKSLIKLPSFTVPLAKSLIKPLDILPYFGITAPVTSSRISYFFEDKVFKTNMRDLGIKPVETFEEIERLKFMEKSI